MDDKKDNIIPKRTIKFISHKNESRKKEEFNSKEKETLENSDKNNLYNEKKSPDIPNKSNLKEEAISREQKEVKEKIKNLFENKLFLSVVSLVPSFLAVFYKIKMAYTFNIPQKYFNINIVEEFFYIIIIGVLLLLYLFFKSNQLKSILLLFLLISQIILFIREEFFLLMSIYIFFSFLFFPFLKIEKILNKYLKEYKNIEKYLKKFKEIEKVLKKSEKCEFYKIYKKEKEYLSVHKELKKYFETEYEIKIKRKIIIRISLKWIIRIVYIFLLSFIFIKLKEVIFEISHYYLFSENKYLWGLYIVFTGIVFFIFYDKENKKSNIKIKYSLLKLIYILNIIFFILLNILTFTSKEKKYEVLCKDNQPKVIITTYEDKYLIMDCDYEEDKNMIENIYTKDYELIKVDDIKNTKLNYADCSKKFNIEHQKKEK